MPFNASVRADAPDAPGRPLVNSFTSRSVDLTWTPPIDVHHEAVTHYLIEKRRGEDGQWDRNEPVTTPNNDTRITVRGLYPFNAYSFRVIAVNAMGESKPSDASYFTMTLRTGES